MQLVTDATKGSNEGHLGSTLHYWMYHEIPLGIELKKLKDHSDWQSWKNPNLDDLLDAIDKDPRIDVVFLDPIGLYTADETRLIIEACKKKGIGINFVGRTPEDWTNLDFDFYVNMGPKNPIESKWSNKLKREMGQGRYAD